MYVMSMYVDVCVCELVCRASLNTQLFHKTDRPRAVGGPNIDLLK